MSSPRIIVALDPGTRHAGVVAVRLADPPQLLGCWPIRAAGAYPVRQQALEAVDLLGHLAGGNPGSGAGVLVVERPPVTARQRTGRAGSQGQVGWGLGRSAGLWMALAAMHWGTEPWQVPVATWRGWWGIGPRGHSERATARIAWIVAGGERQGRTYPESSHVQAALLLGVGAALHWSDAPSQGRIR